MAEPSRQLPQDRTPGNADSDPAGSRKFGVIPGGGETSAPTGNLRGIDGSNEQPTEQGGSKRPDLKVLPGGGEGDAESSDNTQHENQVGAGYKPGGDKKKKNSFDRIRQLRKRQKLLMAGGGIAGLLAAIILMLFGFLNVFKLDHMISNVDAQTFARLHGVEDRRSLAWMQAYMTMRLADMGDNPDLDKGANSDNAFFRSEKVRKNPVTDWYRTLRTSKFEQEVFGESGFKFVSVYDKNTGRIRPGKIILNGKTLQTIDISNADWDGLSSGNTDAINKYSNLVDLKTYDNDKQARKAIKKAVDAKLRPWQVYKKRAIRKDIQHMIGVRDWRFFENTRGKIDEKKIDIRNKLIRKAIPESTKAGKFVRCLFGMAECRLSNDTSDPKNAADNTTINDKNPDKTGDSVNATDSSGKPLPPEYVAPKEAADAAKAITKSIFDKVAPVLGPINIVSTLDSFSSISKSIHNHVLSKGVAMAKGTQAMGLFQTLTTARDQIKTGQLSGAEANALMKTLGPVAHSEGFSKVISGQGDPKSFPDTPARHKYCSKKNQALIENNPVEGNKQFAWICPNQRIGGSSTAASIEDAWNGSIGGVVDQIVNAYEGPRHAPIIGAFFSIINSISGAVSGIIMNLLEGVLSLVGLQDNFENAIAWLLGQVGAFLGATPILSQNYSAPVLFNWLVQGGAFTAEASARSQGAAKTTPASHAATQLALAESNSDQASQKSVFDKYLSLNQYDSVASKQMFALTQLNFSAVIGKLTNFGTIFKTLGNALTLPFNHKVGAVNAGGYAGTDLAGIDTVDFPPECINYDILNATPQNGTNAQEVIKEKVGKIIPDDELTWDLVSSKDDWYTFIYDKIGERDDADDIALTIYNCNLNERSARGGTGFLYGYTDDGGYEDTGGGQ